MSIVSLGLEHEAALADFLADFAAAGEEWIPAYFPDRDWPHPRIVSALAAWSRGEDMPDGWRACSTWFLVEGGLVLGVVNLRHELDEFLMRRGGHVGYSVRPSARGRGCATRMLAAALDRGREMGIARFLVTCDADNLASATVIERNGGVLEEIVDVEGEMTRRYWVG